MEYLLLIYGDPATAPAFDSPEGQAQHAGWMRFTDEVADRTLAGAALQPATTATTVRTGKGETLTLDGPFAETKEVLGGFYLVDVRTSTLRWPWPSRPRASAATPSRSVRG